MNVKRAASVSNRLTVNIKAEKLASKTARLCVKNATQDLVVNTIEHLRFQGIPMRRCQHGVFNPDEGTELAWSCSLCYPQGHPSNSAMPQFNRRNSMSLTETGKLPKCPKCESILAVSRGGVCRHCGTEYEIQAPSHLRANNAQPGICPACGSGVHFTGRTKREWECADCGHHYTAPKKVE